MQGIEPRSQILVQGIAEVACHNLAGSASIEPARYLRGAGGCK